MFAQLLPGLRQIRTPVASGVLWIVLGWLVLAGRITRHADPALFRSLDSLSRALKPLGVGLQHQSRRLFGRRVVRERLGPHLSKPPRSQHDRTLRLLRILSKRLDALPPRGLVVYAACRSYSARSRFGVSRLFQAGDADPDGTTDTDWHARSRLTGEEFGDLRSVVVRDLMLGVESELDVTGTRLLAKHKELFNIYDRLKSEAEFRTAVAIPLAAVVAVILDDVVATWIAVLLGLATLALCLVEARSKKTSAGDRIVDALIIGETSAPALDDVESGMYTTEAFQQNRITIEEDPASAVAVLGVPISRRVSGSLRTGIAFELEVVSQAGTVALRAGSRW